MELKTVHYEILIAISSPTKSLNENRNEDTSECSK